MKRYNNQRILCFGDPHGPYHHKDTLDFLADVSREYQPDRIFHMGDHADIYSVSSYPKDIHHKDTWTDELKGLRRFTKDLAAIFPKLEMMSSNHDDRVYKASRIAGVPREFLVKYLDVIDAPEGWKLHKDLRVRVESNKQHFHFCHTIAGGSFSAAKQLGVSVVMGHSHTKFGATAFHNGDHIVWGIDTGCLISDKGSPYKYNKIQIGRPIRGCIMIIDGTPLPIPMRG